MYILTTYFVPSKYTYICTFIHTHYVCRMHRYINIYIYILNRELLQETSKLSQDLCVKCSFVYLYVCTSKWMSSINIFGMHIFEKWMIHLSMKRFWKHFWIYYMYTYIHNLSVKGIFLIYTYSYIRIFYYPLSYQINNRQGSMFKSPWSFMDGKKLNFLAIIWTQEINIYKKKTKKKKQTTYISQKQKHIMYFIWFFDNDIVLMCINIEYFVHKIKCWSWSPSVKL